jgi:hypothetical protein
MWLASWSSHWLFPSTDQSCFLTGPVKFLNNTLLKLNSVLLQFSTSPRYSFKIHSRMKVWLEKFIEQKV